ncbi:MAG: excalibur calcium-binding domain-containing protein [Rhodanobacteraceae bacterium]|nr:excalibur calcium-binding domain-containing protein [Rhodanobacteraceae bacterium]
MPFTGTLDSWNDDRGFGFIAPAHGGVRVFVHISEFPRSSTRPLVGERLGYELGRSEDGRPRAVRIVRLTVDTKRPVSASVTRSKRTGLPWPGILVALMLLVAPGLLIYEHLASFWRRQSLAAEPAPLASQRIPAPPAATFQCDGRTHCSQMASCAEATWFINNCPGTAMDGDGDGVPCERQWCE